MADSETLADLDITKGEKILVTVESSLSDIIVVSFVHGLKSFQGALLDSTKRGLPCGIEPPEPITGPDADKLATIATRFSYFQEKKCSSNVVNKINPQRNVNSVGKCKNSRPTVRLRPRQVLCNNCRSICNEKNENVDGSRKRKHDDSTTTSIVQEQIVRRSDRRCSQQTEKLNHTNNVLNNDLKILIPKISRLRTNKVTNELINSEKKINNFGINLNEKTSWLRQRAEEVTALNNSNKNQCTTSSLSSSSSSSVIEPTESSTVPPVDLNVVNYCATPRRLSSLSVESAKIPKDNEEKTQMVAADSTVKSKSSTGRISRKKRSVGSMEDLWDESVFIEQSRNTRTTPIIKISFGSQGEGTVLEIPSKIKNETIGESENEIDIDNDDKNEDEINNKKINQDVDDGLQEQLDPQKQNYSKDFSCTKAAKRALKRAKKEARRKMLNSGNNSNIISPARSPLSTSPRYNPSYDPLSYHRRKHKVKHKKKHKEERKHKNQQQKQELIIDNKKSDDTKESTIFNIIPTVDCGESYMAIKEQCLKKKLSISLKRLNTNAYARCEYPVSNGSSGCKSPGASSEELSELEPENHEVNTNENPPEFPPPTHPLAMRLGSPTAVATQYCLTASGRRMDVGDVVWGKVHGFPWWPGKVLSISLPCEDDDGTPPDAQAHVAWYGSSTCSLMSCDRLSPFLEMFKARYNKKKRGPYKEAIKQAQLEAHINVTLSKYDK